MNFTCPDFSLDVALALASFLCVLGGRGNLGEQVTIWLFGLLVENPHYDLLPYWLQFIRQARPVKALVLCSKTSEFQEGRDARMKTFAALNSAILILVH